MPDNFSFPDLPYDFSGQPTPMQSPPFIGPKQVVNTLGATMTLDEIIATQKRERFAYFYGWARYGDIFDYRATHITRFCYWIANISGDVRKSIIEGPPEMIIEFQSCGRGNCADEDCAQQGLP